MWPIHAFVGTMAHHSAAVADAHSLLVLVQCGCECAIIRVRKTKSVYRSCDYDVWDVADVMSHTHIHTPVHRLYCSRCKGNVACGCCDDGTS